MPLINSIKRILRGDWLPLERVPRAIPMFMKPWIETGALVAIAATVLWLASRIHWVVGGFVILLLAAFVLLLLRGLHRALTRDPFRHPAYTVVRIFTLIVSIGAVMCAWASHQLYLEHRTWYEPVNARYAIIDFAALYAWMFIDMIPGLKAWETLGISAPVDVCTPVARIPLLAFRILVVFGVLASFSAWTRARRSATASRAEPKLPR